jgi:hypothetical protein
MAFGRQSMVVASLALLVAACTGSPGGSGPASVPSPSPSSSTGASQSAGPSPSAGASQGAACLASDAELEQAARAVAGNVTLPSPGVEGDVDEVKVEICRTTETAATATVTLLGHRDDSVQDSRHALTLEKQAGTGWVVTKDVTTYRCRPGRGQQEFSPALCV